MAGDLPAYPLASDFAALGIHPDASLATVREAFLDLARHSHPDVNPSENADAEFQEILAAYQAISAWRKGQLLAERTVAGAWPGINGVLEPLHCSSCGRITIEPRKLSFAFVVSFFLLFSWGWRSKGLFCSRCARRSALQASVVTGLAGWWSLSGLIRTPLAILENARGGDRDRETDARLLFYNLLAFRARGDHRAVAEIAARLVTGPTGLPMAESLLVTSIAIDPAIMRAASTRRTWQRRFVGDVLHTLLFLAVPIALFLAGNAIWSGWAPPSQGGGARAHISNGASIAHEVGVNP